MRSLVAHHARRDSVGQVKTPLWLWVNLLSLDAPIVALIWQDFVARCFPSMLLVQGRCVLGLTVWAIYLADRLMDVRHPAVGNETARHRFYRNNKGAASVLLAVVVLADLVIALHWVRPAVFVNGVLVSIAVGSYLAVFALFRTGRRHWKRPSAAILFTSGIFLVAWTLKPEPWQVLGLPAAAFGALCLGNLEFIERWEHGRSTAHGWIWMLLLCALCVLLGGSRWYFAVGISAAGLAALDRQRNLLSDDARHVLADAVLLTPLIFR